MNNAPMTGASAPSKHTVSIDRLPADVRANIEVQAPTAAAVHPDLMNAVEDDRPVIVDIKDTAAAALPYIEGICAHWLPDGKRQGHNWIARNPTRDDAHPGSFSISLLTGGCIDHATGEQCHDIVSTIKYLDGLPTQGEAAKRVADFIDSAPVPQPRKTPKKAAPRTMNSRPEQHPRLGIPSATWDYLDASGAVICAVLRFETATGKEFRPLTRTPDGWIWKAPGEPRPLYGLDRLAAHPDADVILAEGEKAADAAAVLLPGLIAVASMNGAMSPKKSDWSPLAGRKVRIWPDHDEPGAQYAKTAASLAYDAGAVSVALLDLSSLADELPQGWDAADALAEGWTPERIADGARWVETANPYAFSGGTEGTSDHDDSDNSPLADAKALILAAIERQADDAGAVFEDGQDGTPDVKAAWNLVYDASQAEYQRLRKLAQNAGASVVEIDKACNIRNRRG